MRCQAGCFQICGNYITGNSIGTIVNESLITAHSLGVRITTAGNGGKSFAVGTWSLRATLDLQGVPHFITCIIVPCEGVSADTDSLCMRIGALGGCITTLRVRRRTANSCSASLSVCVACGDIRQITFRVRIGGSNQFGTIPFRVSAHGACIGFAISAFHVRVLRIGKSISTLRVCSLCVCFRKVTFRMRVLRIGKSIFAFRMCRRSTDLASTALGVSCLSPYPCVLSFSVPIRFINVCLTPLCMRCHCRGVGLHSFRMGIVSLGIGLISFGKGIQPQSLTGELSDRGFSLAVLQVRQVRQIHALRKEIADDLSVYSVNQLHGLIDLGNGVGGYAIGLHNIEVGIPGLQYVYSVTRQQLGKAQFDLSDIAVLHLEQGKRRVCDSLLEQLKRTNGVDHTLTRDLRLDRRQLHSVFGNLLPDERMGVGSGVVICNVSVNLLSKRRYCIGKTAHIRTIIVRYPSVKRLDRFGVCIDRFADRLMRIRVLVMRRYSLSDCLLRPVWVVRLRELRRNVHLLIHMLVQRSARRICKPHKTALSGGKVGRVQDLSGADLDTMKFDRFVYFVNCGNQCLRNSFKRFVRNPYEGLNICKLIVNHCNIGKHSINLLQRIIRKILCTIRHINKNAARNVERAHKG